MSTGAAGSTARTAACPPAARLVSAQAASRIPSRAVESILRPGGGGPRCKFCTSLPVCFSYFCCSRAGQTSRRGGGRAHRGGCRAAIRSGTAPASTASLEGGSSTARHQHHRVAAHSAPDARLLLLLSSSTHARGAGLRSAAAARALPLPPSHMQRGAGAGLGWHPRAPCRRRGGRRPPQRPPSGPWRQRPTPPLGGTRAPRSPPRSPHLGPSRGQQGEECESKG